MINQNDNFNIRAGKPIDKKFGPYIDINQAILFIPRAQRYNGLIFGIYNNPDDLFISDITYYYFYGDFSDVEYKRIGKKPVDNIYTNTTELVSNQENDDHLEGFFYFITDTNTYYEYIGTTNGNISDYRALSSGGSGFTLNILNNDGDLMPNRDNLQFKRLIVTDNGSTITEVTRPPSVFMQTTPPVDDIMVGDEWININNWKKYVYYDDFWVNIGSISTGGGVLHNSLPDLEGGDGVYFYHLGLDYYNAAINANNPSEINPFLTLDDAFTLNIFNNEGDLMPNRDNLQFKRLIVTDNGSTITEVTRPAAVFMQTTPPITNILIGDEWININNWKKYVYYDDFWVNIGSGSSSGSSSETISLELIETQSTVVKFDELSGYVHGNGGAINSSISYDFTGAIRGVVNIMTHNSTSFTPPVGSKIIGGYYSPSVNNYITFELINKTPSSEIVLITISQDV